MALLAGVERAEVQMASHRAKWGLGGHLAKRFVDMEVSRKKDL